METEVVATTSLDVERLEPADRARTFGGIAGSVSLALPTEPREEGADAAPLGASCTHPQSRLRALDRLGRICPSSARAAVAP
jgi:hypothetical protein